MRILVLHRLPANEIRYAQAIDHAIHQVTYVGVKDRLANLPDDLPCTRLERPGTDDVAHEVLAAVAGMPHPDLVVALAESDLIPAARVREHLGVEGAREDAVLPVRDKVVMKAAVAAAGLSTPRFLALEEILTSSTRKIPWQGPTVLKPRGSAMSQHVQVFPTPSATLDRVASQGIPGGGQSTDFEIEEFIDAPVVHVDGLVVDDEVVVSQAYRYEGTCLEFAEGRPQADIQIETTPELSRWASDCLKAVGLRTSIFHLEGFQTPQGMVFLEIGARHAGGGTMDTFELATGVHLPSSYLRLLMSGGTERPEPRTPDPENLYADFIYPCVPHSEGRVTIQEEARFRENPLVRRWQQRAPETAVAHRLSYAVADAPLGGVIGPAASTDLSRYVRELFDTVVVRYETA